VECKAEPPHEGSWGRGGRLTLQEGLQSAHVTFVRWGIVNERAKSVEADLLILKCLTTTLHIEYHHAMLFQTR